MLFSFSTERRLSQNECKNKNKHMHWQIRLKQNIKINTNEYVHIEEWAKGELVYYSARPE